MPEWLFVLFFVLQNKYPGILKLFQCRTCIHFDKVISGCERGLSASCCYYTWVRGAASL